MRLTERDAVATLFVATAGAVYALWQTGTAVAYLSTRAVGAIVIGLGWAATAIHSTEMAALYARGARHPAAWVHLVLTSVIAVLAVVAAVVTIAAASEPMLAVLVAATISLWVLATLRHAVGPPHRSGNGTLDPSSCAVRHFDA